MLEFRFLEEGEHFKYRKEMLEMLTEGDNDFVPPLSSRSSTTQSSFSEFEGHSAGVLRYFEAMEKQSFLIAKEDGKLLAFVSFIENYANDKITEKDIPNIYISTLLAKSECRGRGITKSMYTMLFDKYADRNVFTRTWSTNCIHINILSKFGFCELCRIKDDRGKGIDTVYFIKRR